MIGRITSDNLVHHFTTTFGTTPTIVGSAPGRVNLIGEHIDYTEGWVLPFAIGYRTEVAVGVRQDHRVLLTSLQRPGDVIDVSLENLEPDSARGWVEYVLGVISKLGITSGLDIAVDGRVPLGAGLSSSAALECATAVALNDLFALGHTSQQLALICQSAENSFVGVPCGIMDQAVSMLATAQHALLLDCKSLETTHIPLNLDSAGLSLLVTDTRAHHSLVDGGYAARRASLENVSRIIGRNSLRDASMADLEAHKSEISETDFRRARHAISEIKRVHEAVEVMRTNDFSTLGSLINDSHKSLRDDYEVSCPELDAAVDAANVLGALGSRMVGGGFGGSAIALIPHGMVNGVRKSITELFAAAGFKEPRFFVATAETGAYSVRL